MLDVAIIGGGISGLSALHFLRHRAPHLEAKLFEADKRLGGTIGTDVVNGYSFDWGPNGFLDREPLTLQFCEEIGLNNRLERANQNVSKRFILRKGRLREVPMAPPKFLFSDILSLKGKARVMLEPMARNRPADVLDETVYDFVQRRIGTEAADYLVQPMVSGVYGGIAGKLSLKSCFPIMREMEDQYGSLFKAMIAKAKAAKKKGGKSGGPSGPGGWLTSFHGGLYTMIEQCEERYEQYIRTGFPVASLYRTDNGYRIVGADGSEFEARKVIVATPANNASEITAKLSSHLSAHLADIPYAPIAVICTGYDKTAVRRQLDGFGFLVPSKENRRILGSIWTSSIFADRAPGGKVQFRTMIGGDGDHESLQLSDDELIEIVASDLGDIVGLEGKPELVKIYRWEMGIPQFVVGHEKKLEAIDRELTRLGDIYVTGNAYRGISLNDCVKQSHRVVEQILA